jgi:hypothetical protein
MMFDLYKALLGALAYLVNFVDILAGITPVMYQGEPVLLYDFFFMMTPISAVFWGITVIGMALALGFSILVVTQKVADLKVEKTMGMVLGQIGKTFAIFLITPLLMIVLLQLTSVIMRQTDQLFDIANNSAGLDRAIFALTASEAVIEDRGVIARFASGALDYNNNGHVYWNLYVHEIRMWIGIPLTAALVVVYFSVLMVVSLRVFNILLLYVVSPLFVSSIVLDDGEKYKLWRSAFVGKLMLGFSLILSVKIVTYILIPFMVSDYALAPNPGGDLVLKAIFMFGALYGAYKSAGVIPKLISPNFGGDDESMMLGMAAAMVKTGGQKTLSMGIQATGEIAKAGVNAAKFVAKMVVKIVIAVVKMIFLGDVSALFRAIFSVIKDTIKEILKKIKEVVKKILKTIADIIDTIMKLILSQTGIDSTGGHGMGVFSHDGKGGDGDGGGGGQKSKVEAGDGEEGEEDSEDDGEEDNNEDKDSEDEDSEDETDDKEESNDTQSNKEGTNKTDNKKHRLIKKASGKKSGLPTKTSKKSSNKTSKKTSNKEGNTIKKTGNKKGSIIKSTGNKKGGTIKKSGNKEGSTTKSTGNKEGSVTKSTGNKGT